MIASEEFDKFFGEIRSHLNILEQCKNYMNKFIGDGFNAFDFIGDEEDRLSDVIVRLLNPTRGHGQGTAFLCGLLDLCVGRSARNERGNRFLELKQKVIQGETVQVKREYMTSRGRFIDIVVCVPGFMLGIENKPWAADQNNQVHDYIKYLKERFEERWAFIYLNGYRRGPSEESLGAECRKLLRKSGHYVELDYANDLAQWLHQCTLACEADKVRWFLRDFRAYTLREFKSVDSMEGNNAR
jgi:hypothetical protein